MSAPRENTLEKAEKLYEVGDYREARRLASAIEGDDSLKAGERDRARRILEATRTDPVALVFSCCLLIFLVLKYAL